MIKLPELTFVGGVSSEQTGGGCMVDFVHLADGRVLGINDECVVLYKSMDDFWDASPENKPTIELIDYGSGDNA